jgi:hypothetical protein
MIKRFILFFTLDWRSKLLLLEAFFYLAWARILKNLPLSKIAQSLGEEMKETPYVNDIKKIKTIKKVSEAINLMSRYTFWESACLVKAIAAQKMLHRRGIESTLYLGTAKDQEGNFIAHSWLRSGTFYVSGFEEMKRFTVVAKYAKEIR